MDHLLQHRLLASAAGAGSHARAGTLLLPSSARGVAVRRARGLFLRRAGR